MKQRILLTSFASALLAQSAFAGEHTIVTSKEVIPPAAPMYGIGFYFGAQAGVNAYQDFGGTRRLTLAGRDVAFEPREKVGFAGGIKFGYVFGTSSVRPAIEADLYYNGVEADLDARIDGRDTDFNAEGNLHSGAFIANFLLRFGTDRFQPYIGAGVGGYYAETQSAEVTIGGRTFDLEGGSNSGFAWQLIGGADYYLNETSSIFVEYKYLNYEDAGFSEDRISQHLGMLGLRWHF